MGKITGKLKHTIMHFQNSQLSFFMNNFHEHFKFFMNKFIKFLPGIIHMKFVINVLRRGLGCLLLNA